MCGRYMTEAFSDIISRSANIEKYCCGNIRGQGLKVEIYVSGGKRG